jgi:hypothetical protein
MSFFGRQGIPDFLHQDNNETTNKATRLYANDAENGSDGSDIEETASECSDVDRFEVDILLLRDFSLIRLGADKTNFEMHRVVQLAM